MGILGGALERRKLSVGGFGDKGLAQFLPALPVFVAAAGEDIVGKFRGAEADEFGDGLLLVGRCAAAFAIEHIQETDRLDIVVRAGLP
ncbi:hypothetical protein [Rhizorhabdus wittichii]|uniref:hypothetical protein n=1 Tax=Rhizorhabdus wittichii TaxID=160791 RepID=UPI001D0304D7|nr:hypothetical protein [Rhizorhabdus wittichii]